MIAFTLCSNNYLAQAKVLGDSYLKHHPKSQFIIGLIDELNENLNYNIFDDFIIIPVKSIGIENLEVYLQKYNIIEFNTFSKPFYFQYLFKNYNSSSIIYLDPDIKIFLSLDEIKTNLVHNDIIITPHLLTPRLDKIVQFETLILNVGIYNLGFIALKKCLNVDDFLTWWGNRLKQYCFIDFINGLFVDQIWTNYIPVYFKNHHILRGFGYNMGYWNFEERTLKLIADNYYVNSKDKLYFFHFSSFNPLEKEKLCKWLNYSFEQRPDLLEIYNEYALELMANNYEKFFKSPPLLSFHNKYNLKFNVSQKIGAKLKRNINSFINKIFNLPH